MVVLFFLCSKQLYLKIIVLILQSMVAKLGHITSSIAELWRMSLISQMSWQQSNFKKGKIANSLKIFWNFLSVKLSNFCPLPSNLYGHTFPNSATTATNGQIYGLDFEKVVGFGKAWMSKKSKSRDNLKVRRLLSRRRT